jgi:organic hydroperoxide reductase OsmC/OhrA
VADKRHTFSIRVDWIGNQGTGTSAYRAYSRAHEISAQGKTAIAGSSDPVFRGDAARWNPAELLIAALSALCPTKAARRHSPSSSAVS